MPCIMPPCMCDIMCCIISGIICLVCLVFLFFESAFGICLGCKFYRLVYREAPTLCPGEVCEARSRQEIQRTSAGQWLALIAFAVLIAVASRALRGRRAT